VYKELCFIYKITESMETGKFGEKKILKEKVRARIGKVCGLVFVDGNEDVNVILDPVSRLTSNYLQDVFWGMRSTPTKQRKS